MSFRMGSESTARGRWLVTHLIVPLAGLGVLIALLESTGLDSRLLEPFYSPISHNFPARKDWFFRHFLHEGGKWVMLSTTVVLALLVIASIWIRRWRSWSGSAAYLVACVAATTGFIGWLKAVTNRYPPWDIDRFGGKVPFTPLFTPTPEPFTNGNGFPAGHASAGFAWVALYFVARAHGITQAHWFLAPGLLLGVSFGWVQHVRGAHFPSHNLWTLAIAWCVAISFTWLFSACGWLPKRTDLSSRRDDTLAKTPMMTIAVRSWLAGVCGLIAGITLFAVDTAVELLDLGFARMHFWLECVEFVIIGPGLGVTCLLLVERIRVARVTAAARAKEERDRRFFVLGRMAAAVAHEVRNPLHTLRLVMDELRFDTPSLRVHPSSQHIDSSLHRIDRAVELVYQLARPSADDEASMDLVPAIREAVTDEKIRDPVSRSIDLGSMPTEAFVRCSTSGLRIMLDNLLRNAVEAAGDHGTVSLTIDERFPDWLVRISNPGEIPLGFSTTAIAEESASRKVGGLGLGLAISRHIAANAGGSIELTQNEGQVITTLRLPAVEKPR